jgi:hypothetical protein
MLDRERLRIAARHEIATAYTDLIRELRLTESERCAFIMTLADFQVTLMTQASTAAATHTPLSAEVANAKDVLDTAIRNLLGQPRFQVFQAYREMLSQQTTRH